MAQRREPPPVNPNPLADRGEYYVCACCERMCARVYVTSANYCRTCRDLVCSSCIDGKECVGCEGQGDKRDEY